MNRFEVVSRIVREHLAAPYAYGVGLSIGGDCFAMGLAVAHALTDVDHGESYRGRYKTKVGAAKIVHRRGGGSLAGLLRQHFTDTAPAQARVGDLAVVLAPDGEHVAVCMGRDFVVKTEHGRRDFGVTDCIAAFRVG